MPKKKKTQSNGFYVYMQELRQSRMSENKGNKITIENMIAVAGPKWKELTDDERKHYNQLAKSQKKKAMKTDDDRLDNQGNVIGHRTDFDEENLSRRERNKEIDYSRWPPVEDILERKFYWISFQTLCEIDEGESWLPCEVALVEWSLQDGITNTYQSFIDPGPIPLGYRFTCQSHSDDTHKIPIEGFELANSDYGNIYRTIEDFVHPRGDHDLYPPIYSLHTHNDEAGPNREVFNNRTSSVIQKPNKGLWARPEGVNIDVPTTFAGRRLAPDPGALPKPVRWQAQQQTVVGSTSLYSSIAQSAPQWVTRPQMPPVGRGFTPQGPASAADLQPNAKSQFSSDV